MAARPYVPRATRYAIPFSVFYRVSGDPTWTEGRAVNISKSGVLVRGSRKMTADSPVEILMNIPSDVQAPFTGPTICQARIVRTVSSQPPEDSPMFAAAISDFDTPFFVDPRRI